MGNFLQYKQDQGGGIILRAPPRARSCQELNAIPSSISCSWEQNPSRSQIGWDCCHPPLLKGLLLLLGRAKHPLVSREPAGIFKKEGKTGLGRTIEFKIFGADESAGVVLGAGVTLQWEVAGNWGKDEPPRRVERVSKGKQLN